MGTRTHDLRSLGQSLWLDNITRGMLDDGTLSRYIRDLGITGLTSNPAIYNLAVKNTAFYDGAIAAKVRSGLAGERLFFDLAIEDLRRAADLFRDVHDASGGLDGWVSLEVSPTLANDAAGTLAAARDLFARADRTNLFIKIPGTPAGLPAIEEAIFAGVPVNVTLLFSRDHYLAAAEAYLRGIERRVEAGLSPRVCSVASLFISRWDAATAAVVPPTLANRLGIAVGRQCYRAYRDLLASDRFQRLANFGAFPQRLLYASTGTKDPKLSDTLYVT
ncbi:MAG: transaldolase family protein, partial [Planctomycetia bacterium]